jgi:hypothetical protein
MENNEVPISQIPAQKPQVETSTDPALREKAESTFAANPDAFALLHADGHFFLENAWHHAQALPGKVVKVFRDAENSMSEIIKKGIENLSSTIAEAEDIIAEGIEGAVNEDDDDDDNDEA